MRVFINPGHGGQDSGAVGHGMKEDDLNLDIASRIEEGLRAYGFEVVTNRTEDRFDSLSTICTKANASRADLFISVHCNDTGYSTHGFEEIYRSTSGKRACEVINSRLAPLTPYGDVGPYSDRRGLAVLRGTQMPAAIIEYLAVSNIEEALQLANPVFRQTCAEATVAGICDYFGVAYNGASAPAAPPTVTPPAPAAPLSVAVHPFPGLVKIHSSNHDAVRQVQQRLHDRGWDIVVDGDFGPRTDSIVRKFQREKALVIDGVVGPNTWGALWTAPVTK